VAGLGERGSGELGRANPHSVITGRREARDPVIHVLHNVKEDVGGRDFARR
jgi:hypothetical protein